MRSTLDGESTFEHDKVQRNGVPRIFDQTDAVSGLPGDKDNESQRHYDILKHADHCVDCPLNIIFSSLATCPRPLGTPLILGNGARFAAPVFLLILDHVLFIV